MNKGLLIEVTGADGTTRVVTPMELEEIVSPSFDTIAEARESRIVLLLSSSWLWIAVGLLTIFGLTRA